MTEAEILWKNILLRANGREVIPRQEIEDMLSTYGKEVWKVLFDKALVGYENNELIVDVSRETLDVKPISIEEF